MYYESSKYLKVLILERLGRAADAATVGFEGTAHELLQMLNDEPSRASLDLSKIDLSMTKFSGISLKDIDFTGANLNGVDFSDSVLVNVCFKNADLRGADFKGAHLTDVAMFGADLRDSYFKHLELVN